VYRRKPNPTSEDKGFSFFLLDILSSNDVFLITERYYRSGYAKGRGKK
jgi:hypothetical protein